MIVKHIKVFIKPGHGEQFLAAQQIWDRETRGATGCLGFFHSQDPARPDEIDLHVFWRSQADLNRWMHERHDAIATQAGSEAHYTRLEVRILEVLSHAQFNR